MKTDYIHSLIPLADFKAILNIDERDDALSRYCLVTASCSIEQYCKRWFLTRRHTGYLSFTGDYIFTLREYPVRKIVSIHANGMHIDHKDYYCIPDESIRI
jgi:hypothetical protein